MTTTDYTPEVEARARQIAARGLIPFRDALDEAERQLRYEAGQIAQAAAAKAQVEPPQPPTFTWDRYDDLDRRAMAELDRNLDPRRSAAKAARRAQIEQQALAIRTQRDALDVQLRKLDDEWHANL